MLEPTDLILDGGPCTVGVESTIAICTDRGVRVARSGGISADQLAELVPVLDADDQPLQRVPGALASHYAPSAAVTVVRTAAELQREYRRHLLGAATVDDYARELYSALRLADEQGLTQVIALAPPNVGIGVAILDRLTRASKQT